MEREEEGGLEGMEEGGLEGMELEVGEDWLLEAGGQGEDLPSSGQVCEQGLYVQMDCRTSTKVMRKTCTQFKCELLTSYG